jgi:DNA polymerase III subunit gamma/tau
VSAGKAGGATAPTTGLAAARAAAAGATRQGGAKADDSNTWSDGSQTEEAPYDPEYDGSPANASYEGFDPGDEPLDDVIDEKTARQSSEQQAVQLLREAFGAEKIREM